MSVLKERLATALNLTGLNGQHGGQGVKLRPKAEQLYFAGEKEEDKEGGTQRQAVEAGYRRDNSEKDLPENALTRQEEEEAEASTVGLKATLFETTRVGDDRARLAFDPLREAKSMPQTYAIQRRQCETKTDDDYFHFFAGPSDNRALHICDHTLILKVDHLQPQTEKSGRFYFMQKMDEHTMKRLYVFSNREFQKSIAVTGGTKPSLTLVNADPPGTPFPSEQDGRVFTQTPADRGLIYLESYSVPGHYISYTPNGDVSLSTCTKQAHFRPEEDTTTFTANPEQEDDPAQSVNHRLARDATHESSNSSSSGTNAEESLPLDDTPPNSGNGKRRKWRKKLCLIM